MNRATLLSVLALVLVFVTVDGKRAGCIKPEVVEISESWIEERGDSYWFAPLGSKLKKASPGDEDEPPPENATLAKKRCWSALVKSPVGAVPFPMDCKYDAYSEQECGLQTKGSPVHKFVRYFGEFSCTLTDDSTYLVAFGCLLGKNDYWVVMSINKKLTSEVEELVLDHIETMGFKRNNLKSDRDLVSIDKVKMVKCKKGKQHKTDSTGLPGEPEKKR